MAFLIGWYIAGRSVEALDPINFYFLTRRVSPEDTEKFRRLRKIVKEWKTYDEIANNKLFRLSKKQLDEIKVALNTKSVDKDRTDADKTEDVIRQNRMECLSYWGKLHA